MPRPSPTDRERETDELLRYLEFFDAYVWRRPTRTPNIREAHAAVVGEFGTAKALQGLRQAVNDTIEQYGHKSKETLAMLDTALREHQAVTFSTVRARYDRTYKRLLKRGHIANETEYYLVAAVLSDLTTLITEEERAVLARLAEAYLGDA